MDIKVSIIIPAYNVNKYIERCIKSAMNQTLKNIEIIVVNDGSTDNTKTIIEKLAKEDTRIVLIHKENAGVSSARNVGATVAKGEFIQYLDGDDWIEKTACQEMYHYAIKNNLDTVVVDFYEDDDKGNIQEIETIKSDKSIMNSKEFLTVLFQGEAHWNIWNLFYSRKLNIKQKENITYGEDLLATFKLILNSENIGILKKPYVHYIHNPTSITNNKEALKINQLFEVYDLIEEEMKEKKIFKLFQKDLEASKTVQIGSFIFKKPYFHNKDYVFLAKKILIFFKTKPYIDNRLGLIQTLLIKIAIFFPNMMNLKLMVYLFSYLLKIKFYLRS